MVEWVWESRVTESQVWGKWYNIVATDANDGSSSDYTARVNNGEAGENHVKLNKPWRPGGCDL